ncbi:MAG: CAP domain-containing protein [Rhodobacteraceae bacterium]|nr:CAP domain-containing protein [Paracoccaceae bacterium]
MHTLARLLVLCLGVLAAPAQSCSVPVADELAIHLDAVNRERARAGMAQLALSPELTRIAQTHACDMSARGYFSHTSPDGTGMMDRLAKARVQGICRAAENIAKGQRDVPQAMRSWTGSAGHRRNILDARMTLVGFGRAPGAYWVQMFAATC